MTPSDRTHPDDFRGDPGGGTENYDIERLLEKRKRLDSILKDKFTRYITVMFSDIVGSTTIAEKIGDIAMRTLLKEHNDIVIPTIKEHNGVFVKSIGDGTLSYFDKAGDALKASIGIQRKLLDYRTKSNPEVPFELRIGLNSGNCLVEDKDISGDVVNVGCRFESLSAPSEICLSEETYKALPDADKMLCVYVKTSPIKGKTETYRVYKVLWRDDSVVTGEEKHRPAEQLTVHPTARLLVHKQGQDDYVVPIHGNGVIIGRSAQSDLCLKEHFVSRQHAKVFKDGEVYYIEDLGSLTGVQLNGNRTGLSPLSDGDVIGIDSITITFIYPDTEVVQDVGGDNDETELFHDEQPTCLVDERPRCKLAVCFPNNTIGQHDIPKEGIFIGRGAECKVNLPDKRVSGKHARVWCSGNEIFIEDLNSRNGTSVDGKEINKGSAVKLKKKQKIEIGPYMLVVVAQSEEVNQETFQKSSGFFLEKLKGLWKQEAE